MKLSCLGARRLVTLNQFHIILFMAKIWLIGWNGENRSKIITVINEWITCLPQLILDFFLSYIYRVLSGWRYLVKVCEGSLTRKSCGFSKFLLAHPHHLNPLLLSHCHFEQIFFKVDSNLTSKNSRNSTPQGNNLLYQPLKKKISLTKKHGETPQAHPSSFILHLPKPLCLRHLCGQDLTT